MRSKPFPDISIYTGEMRSKPVQIYLHRRNEEHINVSHQFLTYESFSS
jgi:hypothetical protein